LAKILPFCPAFLPGPVPPFVPLTKVPEDKGGSILPFIPA